MTSFERAVEAAKEIAILRSEGAAIARLRAAVHHDHGNPHPFRHPTRWMDAQDEAAALIERRATALPPS